MAPPVIATCSFRLEYQAPGACSASPADLLWRLETMDAAIQRALNDKLYDKRKVGALE